MPAPIQFAPVALKLAGVGLVGAAALIARRRPGLVRRAAVLDAAPDGARLSARPVPGGAEVAAEGRFRRLWRARPSAAVYELDFAFLARLRIRRAD